jgi:RNA polymerase sigma factor for flagellar operon FliA
MRPKQSELQRESELAAKYISLAQRLAANLSSRCDRLDHDHIESAAQVGLLRAIRSHDPARGTLTTWIARCCHSEMLTAIRELDFLSRHLRRKSKKRQSAIDYLTQQLQHPPTDEELEAAGVPYPEPPQLCQLDEERLPRAKPHRCTIAEADAFREATRGLSLLEQTVLYLIYYQEASQKSVATVLGLAESRISQILREIMKKLRQSNFFEALYDKMAE